MKKIIHLIHSDLKFAEGAVRFLDSINTDGNHYVLYVNTGNSDGLILHDIKTKQKEYVIKKGNELDKVFRIVKLCEKFDFVVFHSLFFYYQIKLAIAMNRALCRKVVWIGFGGDLYVLGGIGSVISTFPNWLIANRCCGYVGIFPPDCKQFEKKFPKSKAKIYYAPYIGGKMPKEYSSYNRHSHLEYTLKKSDTVTILIGNCADEAMGHRQVFSYLERFADRDIKLIIPLSYGDKSYGDEIEEEARKVFGNKALCLRKMMTEDDYFEFLRIVDIGIFNVNRQQALGNINRLIFRNVKIYLPEKSVMYGFYKGRGVPVCKVGDLEKASFKEFISLPIQEDGKKFDSFIRSFYSLEFAVSKWKEIYRNLENYMQSYGR